MKTEPGMVAYVYNPSIQESKAREPQFSGQPRIHRKIAIFYLKTKKKTHTIGTKAENKPP